MGQIADRPLAEQAAGKADLDVAGGDSLSKLSKQPVGKRDFAQQKLRLR